MAPGINKKVLMICYYYPPIRSSGVSRSLGFSNFLKKFDWEPLILTVKNPRERWTGLGEEIPEGISIFRVGEINLVGIVNFLQGAFSRVARFFKKEIKFDYFRDLICIPDSQILWIPLLKGFRINKKIGYDVIYVSSSPFSAAIWGTLLKKLTKKPLVLDFRDPWTLNNYTPHTRVHNYLAKVMERFVIKNCDRLILNTEGAARLYKKSYPQWHTKFSHIHNGYDELTPVEAKSNFHNELVIMHVGTFYGSRSPALLLEALEGLEQDMPIKFIQVGGTCEELEKYTGENYTGKVKVEIHPSMSRSKALEMMQQADILYLKQGWEPGVTQYTAVAAKTYEYLATGLPIIADVPAGDNAEIIKRYALNSYLVTSNNKDDLREALKEALNDATKAHLFSIQNRPNESSSFQGTKQVSATITKEFIEDFSRENLTRKLCEVLNSLE